MAAELPRDIIGLLTAWADSDEPALNGLITDFHFGFPSTVEYTPASIQLRPRVAFSCAKASFLHQRHIDPKWPL
jgi:hypothetical protein